MGLRIGYIVNCVQGSVVGNQLEKNLEDEMEAGVTQGLMGIRVSQIQGFMVMVFHNSIIYLRTVF